MVGGSLNERGTVSSKRLLETLAPLATATANALFAFDADGTLWSGDVGDDVFHEAVTSGLLREEARDALAREASAHGLETAGSSSAIAGRLFAAYHAGKYPERSTYELMTWCYAGFSSDALTALARRTFEQTGLATRLHAEIAPILRFAREAGVRIAVVSASPLLIVREAVRAWGLEGDAVAASCPALAADVILDHLAAPIPYAETKPHKLKALAPEHELLASFGDSAFDIELLCAARVGVAVRPKPALRARLADLPGILLLEAE
jgi:phosphoserine phosphatase